MNFFKESPRDARSTTTAGIRARLTRTLSMALAVAITAILLPAAIHTVDRYGRTADFTLNGNSTANQDTGQKSPTCQ